MRMKTWLRNAGTQEHEEHAETGEAEAEDEDSREVYAELSASY